MKTIDKLPRYILEEVAKLLGFRRHLLGNTSDHQLAQFISDSTFVWEEKDHA